MLEYFFRLLSKTAASELNVTYIYFCLNLEAMFIESFKAMHDLSRRFMFSGADPFGDGLKFRDATLLTEAWETIRSMNMTDSGDGMFTGKINRTR